MTRSRTCPQALAQRARMILLAFEGLDNGDIAERIGGERQAVGSWRRRWLVRRVIKRGNFPLVVDRREKIRLFLDYFNRTLAKPFKWTFTGRPLNV